GFQKGRDRGGDRIILPADEVAIASRRQRQTRAGFLLQQIIGQRAGDQRQREQDNKKNPGGAARPPAWLRRAAQDQPLSVATNAQFGSVERASRPQVEKSVFSIRCS